TDQGSVYSSMAYNDLVQNTNIIRSMSRAGKPTDNPVNESLNGWIKEELFADFHLNEFTDRAWVSWMIEEYVDYYNEQRPSYALGYETPNDFYRSFISGRLERKNTFESRFDEPPHSR
ncbi:MAG: integrase core domain-containing protein, partial [Lachnospiraceae bacterium]|nr:integrase core domain-containing protein [Lachnospiraceae bacterium]